jgi:hypothetical protein
MSDSQPQPTVKVRLDTDERYPDRRIIEPNHWLYDHTDEYEVDAATARRWRKVIAAYDRTQDEMRVVMYGEEDS